MELKPQPQEIVWNLEPEMELKQNGTVLHRVAEPEPVGTVFISGLQNRIRNTVPVLGTRK
jgi:hypothetical protein